MSDVRSETCAVDCVFYIRAFRGACECTWKYYRSISKIRGNQGHDKRGEIWMSPCISIVEVLIKVTNGLVMTLEEDKRFFMCLAVLLCEQFCRFANGGAN